MRNLYYRHAALIFRRWRDWTGRPEFYFIPLDLEMEYVLSTGLTLRPGSGPCFLGSLLRLRHSYPDLFNATCPEGHPAYTYRFAGSPLSGRVTLDLVCPDCGWQGCARVSGWHARSEALKTVQREDIARLECLKEMGKFTAPADLRDLLRHLGLPESEIPLSF